MDPFIKFRFWYQKEQERTEVRIPSACCLSTIGTDGYPNARFVSLKDIKDGQFIVTGPMDSRKGMEVMNYPKAALTFWWTATEKQVRVQGDVRRIKPAEADRYFRDRSRESRIVSWISSQGKPLEDIETIEAHFRHFQELHKNKEILRPENWGGIRILPVRIEFLEFNTERLHHRILCVKNGDSWLTQNLQP